MEKVLLEHEQVTWKATNQLWRPYTAVYKGTNELE